MGRRPKSAQRFAFPKKDTPSDPLTAATSTAEVAVKSAEQNAAEKKEIKKAAEAIPVIFTPEQVAFVFDVYVLLICLVYSLLFKCEFKPLWEELKFDESEKLNLARPLATIASKYAPSAWAGMTAEIELVTSLGVWTVASFRRAQVISEAEKKRKEEEARRNVARPTPVTDARSNRAVSVPL